MIAESEVRKMLAKLEAIKYPTKTTTAQIHILEAVLEGEKDE